MELTSNITEELRITAESTGEEQPGKKDKKGKAEPNTSAENSVSAAIVIGVENNGAHAIIDSGAHLDSMRALRLISGVTYPFLTRPDEFIPVSAGELSDAITSQGFDFVNTYFDGTGGLKSLFNTWARSTTSSDKMAVAGSINVVVFTNVAESIVHGGAIINQDPFYRPAECFYLRPGDPGYIAACDPTLGNYDPAVDYSIYGPGLDHVRSLNANNVDEHVVSIEATNYMQFMNVTGVFGFHLPSLELSSPLGNGYDDVDMSFDASLTPTHGGKGGVGGAIFLQFLEQHDARDRGAGRPAVQRHQLGSEHQGRGGDHGVRVLAGRCGRGQGRRRRHVLVLPADERHPRAARRGLDRHRRPCRRVRRQPRDADQLGRQASPRARRSARGSRSRSRTSTARRAP